MISKDEVKHIAKLARLELTEQEIEKMQKDLSSVLDYFDLLKRAQTSQNVKNNNLNISLINLRPAGLRESLRVQRANKGVREDIIKEKPASLANNLIAAAPKKQDEYIKVKAIL